MPSFHAASIIASCVRMEYPAEPGALDIPNRSARIRRPDSENNGDRLSADIVVETPSGANPEAGRERLNVSKIPVARGSRSAFSPMILSLLSPVKLDL